MKNKLQLIGYASGLAGADPNCAKGPKYLKAVLEKQAHPEAQFVQMIESKGAYPGSDDEIAAICFSLAQFTKELTKNNERFLVIGGDHTTAIGTWSGVADALQHEGDIGLIWIDAHMDSHTPETSFSQRRHGMPLAILLGAGTPQLTDLLDFRPKLKPQHIVLIGVRSYEPGEALFLKQQQVKIYFMEDVERLGFDTVLEQAIDHVSQSTVGFGISLDLDAIDPLEAPAVDVPEPNGIHTTDLFKGLSHAVKHPRFLSAEVVEFDPVRDIDNRTTEIILKLLQIFK